MFVDIVHGGFLLVEGFDKYDWPDLVFISRTSGVQVLTCQDSTQIGAREVVSSRASLLTGAAAVGRIVFQLGIYGRGKALLWQNLTVSVQISTSVLLVISPVTWLQRLSALGRAVFLVG